MSVMLFHLFSLSGICQKRPDIDQWDYTIYSSYIWSIEQTLPESMIWVHFSFPSQNCAGHFLEATGERTHYQGQCGAAAVPGFWEVGVSSVCLWVCARVFVCLSVCLSVCLWQCGAATVPGLWEVCVSVCLSVSVCTCVCLSVTMWSSYSARIVRGVCVCLSVCECVHMCVCLCVCIEFHTPCVCV